jgi:hypothetical protein
MLPAAGHCPGFIEDLADYSPQQAFESRVFKQAKRTDRPLLVQLQQLSGILLDAKLGKDNSKPGLDLIKIFLSPPEPFQQFPLWAGCSLVCKGQ